MSGFGSDPRGAVKGPKEELASLLSTLDLDMPPPARETAAGNARASGDHNRTNASGHREEVSRKNNNALVDTYDATVLHCNAEISLRTKLGKYMSAVPTSSQDGSSSSSNSSHALGYGNNASQTGTVGQSNPNYPNRSATNSAPYMLGMEGQGVGDPLDCLTFVPIDSNLGISSDGTVSQSQYQSDVNMYGRGSLNHNTDVFGSGAGTGEEGEDEGILLPLRYGMTVAIRAPAARERYLGSREGKMGFYR